MAEQGVVRRFVPDKGFGFIPREGKDDLFFHKADYPKGETPREGDRLEFDEVPGKDGKKPRAGNIKILERGAATLATPAAVTTAATTPVEVPLEVEVVSLKETKGESVITFLVGVIVCKDGKPFNGAKVSLTADNKPATDPKKTLVTNQNGQAIFRVSVDKKKSECLIVPTVNGKSSSFSWIKGEGVVSLLLEKPTPKPAPKAVELPTLGPKVSERKSADCMTYVITSKPGEKVVVESVLGSALQVRIEGERDWREGTKLEFDSTGSLILQVRLFSLPLYKGGDHVTFTSGGETTKPFYVSGIYLVRKDEKQQSEGQNPN